MRFWIATIAVMLHGSCSPPRQPDAPRRESGRVPVTISRENGTWVMRRAGQRYFIKGAGGGGHLDLLAAYGGNSTRTWGVEQAGALDDALARGLTVEQGIGLAQEYDPSDGHETGFYADASTVAAQLDQARAAVRKYRDHPALLMWGVGNELELPGGGVKAEGSDELWKAWGDLVRMVKREDPDHPTSITIAFVDEFKLRKIEQYMADSLDVLGINCYEAFPNVGDFLVAHPTRFPVVITEYGPPGNWAPAGGFTPWGAPIEMSSTEKAAFYRDGYIKTVLGHPELILGAYAFVLGDKWEGTPTWFGLLTHDDALVLEPLDQISHLWTGRWPNNRAPRIDAMTFDGAAQRAAPGALLHATVTSSDPDGDPVRVRWSLRRDDPDHEQPDVLPALLESANGSSLTFHAPRDAGPYRLYAEVRDRAKNGRDKGSAANVESPFLVAKTVATP